MTAGSYEHEMMDEVREARRALTKARLAEIDARTAFREAQAERATKERALEEILDAIATGDTGRPLFDKTEAEAMARAEAEEHDKLAAESRAGGKSTAKAKRPATIEGGTREPREGEDEYHRELRAALHTFQDAEDRWAAAIARGATDAELKELIGREFGIEGGASGPGRKGNWHAGGKNPRWWFGSQARNGKPDLSGAALVKAVRELLGVPQPRPTIEVDDRADDAPAPTGPKPTIEGDPSDWKGVIDPCSLHPWQSTPIKAVVKGADLVSMLRETEVKTLGDVFDACELCGGVEAAFEDLGPIHVAAIDHDVRAWARSHPGFPLDVLDAPAPPDPPAGGWTGYQLDRELMDALYPAGFDPGWAKHRDSGISDGEIDLKLAALWPEQPDFRREDDEVLGHTIRGGDRPAFWMGHAFPGGSLPRIPTLAGPHLCDAIRRVLRLPHLVDPMAAEVVEQPKPRKAKSKPAAAR